ncbi:MULTISPECIES: hypothetical protein [Deefgea]|uniref:Uncharacterized protein n=1 Tax=Deefgea chitinilytica TaxID=570276 RepID=A0ABS2CAG1_9NEIS|nr:MULTISPECIES: hypothetical protein [Deefgea]MBM5571138.1 hypothetical protein [Deefgea chitinilytica]MBM9888368.1 hypothetical protein [Deefgea sp. CFH1-16]
MNKNQIEIGGVNFNALDIQQFWIDSESPEEKKIRYYYQDHHYLGSVFSLFSAGLVSSFLRSRKNKSPRNKYLHIRTKHYVAYSFSEADINIDDAMRRIKNSQPESCVLSMFKRIRSFFLK